MALWDKPGYWYLERQTRLVVEIPDDSFNNTNFSCSDLVLLQTGKTGLSKKFTNCYAVSRTINALNFIDIKGRTVYPIVEVKNSSGRNEKLSQIMMDFSDNNEIFKFIFQKEIVTNKRTDFTIKKFKDKKLDKLA